jgi:WD40 repeat protein
MAVVFSSDSRLVATASYDGTACVSDIKYLIDLSEDINVINNQIEFEDVSLSMIENIHSPEIIISEEQIIFIQHKSPQAQSFQILLS